MNRNLFKKKLLKALKVGQFNQNLKIAHINQQINKIKKKIKKKKIIHDPVPDLMFF